MPLDSTPPVFEPAKPPQGKTPKELLKDLQEHLQTAIFVEMTTIPLYLYAYYSIKSEQDGDYARKVIKGVVAEEMLHLALAGNTLLSTGCKPITYARSFTPTFPAEILYAKVKMDLQAGLKSNIKAFVDVEAPAPCFPVMLDASVIPEYHSIAECYQAIQQSSFFTLSTLLDECKEYIKPDPKQISEADGVWHKPGLTVVTDLKTAKDAMQTIIVQGEGNFGDGGHYVQFLDLYESTKTWSCHPVMTNPKTQSYRGKQFYEVSLTLDAAYCYLLLSIERLFRVQKPANREACTTNMHVVMGKLIPPLANFLVGEDFGTGEVAGPCFCYYQLDLQDPRGSVKKEIAAAVVKYTGDKRKQLVAVQESVDKLVDLPVED